MIPKNKIERITRCEDLVHTYWLGQVQNHMQVFEFPYFETNCQDGRMRITWRSAEMGDLLAIHVEYEDDRLKSWVEFKRGNKTFQRQL